MSSRPIANSKVGSDKSFVDDLTASGYCKRWEWALSYDPLRFIPCCRDLCFLVGSVYCGLLAATVNLCVLWFSPGNLDWQFCDWTVSGCFGTSSLGPMSVGFLIGGAICSCWGACVGWSGWAVTIRIYCNGIPWSGWCLPASSEELWAFRFLPGVRPCLRPRPHPYCFIYAW